MNQRITRDHLTLSEAHERLQDEKRPLDRELDSEAERCSESWDLNTGFTAARELATNGWQECADKLEDHLAKVEELMENSWSVSMDVTGECVDIGAFLDGTPECMLSVACPELQSVQIVVNITARSDADAPRLLNRGIAVASAVYALQKSGFGVSLCVGDWVDGSWGSPAMHETLVEVNSYSEYIDPARLAFWLGHPAALRRCFFRYSEQQPMELRQRFGFHAGGGYGRPRDPTRSEIGGNSVIFVPFPRTKDLDEYDTPEKAFAAVRAILREQGVRFAE